MLRYVYIFLLFLSVGVAGNCANNSDFQEHTNPLDTIFDDGNFRVVLAPPTNDGTSWSIAWSDVETTVNYRKFFDSFNRSDWKLQTGNLLQRSGSASDSDIATIKGGTALTGYSTAASVTQESNGSINGSADITSLISVTRSYVLELTYTFEGDTVVTMHSNVVTEP